MKTSEFDYDLPDSLIAQEPAESRDGSRMLVVDRVAGRIQHRHFAELPGFLEENDLLVVNNTRVIPARVLGKKQESGGKVELLLLEEEESNTWRVLLRASRRPAIGSVIELADGQASATLLEDGEKGKALIRVSSPGKPFLSLLEDSGLMPLPPYIKRKASNGHKQMEDRERYQTVFAQHPGAVAAPTAGLHFTPEIFEQLGRKGVQRSELTLHVGIGTFRPVSADQLQEHVMEEERYEISEESATAVGVAKERGGRIVAVGSTSVRTLEAVHAKHGEIAASAGRTDLFIYPPFEFQVVDAMVTNFHLPKSTLLMMVCALAGKELIMKAYEEAIEERYRFYSYGDCMLII